MKLVKGFELNNKNVLNFIINPFFYLLYFKRVKVLIIFIVLYGYETHYSKGRIKI